MLPFNYKKIPKIVYKVPPCRGNLSRTRREGAHLVSGWVPTLSIKHTYSNTILLPLEYTKYTSLRDKKIPFCTSPRFSVTPCLCTHLHLRVCLVSHTLSESHLRAAIIGAEAIWGLYLSALNFRALNFLLSNQKY